MVAVRAAMRGGGGEVGLEARAAALEAVDALLEAADRREAAPARVAVRTLAPHGAR